MTKPFERIRRLRLGPLDIAGPASGLTGRLLGNPVSKRMAQRREAKELASVTVSQQRVTRETLAAKAAADPEAAKIVDKIKGLTWYHTIDLGHGVETPGFADHRQQMPLYGLPESLVGKRCLDIATFDGYFAFEFERRGGEVVAIDIADRTQMDCPRWLLRDPEAFDLVGSLGDSFKVAHKLLKSKVKRVEKSVYDLDPAVDGMFDLVFISDVLIHLRDPQLAIERAYSVCKGELIVADVYSPELEAFGNVPVAQLLAPSEAWWYQNVAGLRQMMKVAGFEPITEVSRFVLESLGTRNHKVVLKGTANPEPSWTKSQRVARERRRAARTDALRT